MFIFIQKLHLPGSKLTEIIKIYKCLILIWHAVVAVVAQVFTVSQLDVIGFCCIRVTRCPPLYQTFEHLSYFLTFYYLLFVP